MAEANLNITNPRGLQTIWIPIEICFFCLKHKFTGPFQVFLYLKIICNGKLKIDQKLKKKIASDLDYKSIKSITNNIKLLQKRDWVGFDYKTKEYYIRSFKQVKNLEGLKRNAAAEFYLTDIQKIKAFLVGALIAKLIKQQQWQARELEPTKHGGSRQGSRNRQIFFPIANLALSKILDIAISTAFELKKLAEQAGYIQVQKKFRNIFANSAYIAGKRHKDTFKSAYSEIAHKIRTRNGKLYEQLPDYVYSNIRLKRKGKKKIVNKKRYKLSHFGR